MSPGVHVTHFHKVKTIPHTNYHMYVEGTVSVKKNKLGHTISSLIMEGSQRGSGVVSIQVVQTNKTSP